MEFEFTEMGHTVGEFRAGMKTMLEAYRERPGIEDGVSIQIKASVDADWQLSSKYEFAFQANSNDAAHIPFYGMRRSSVGEIYEVVTRTTFVDTLAIGLDHNLAKPEYLEQLLSVFESVFEEQFLFYEICTTGNSGFGHSKNWSVLLFSYDKNGEVRK